MPGLTLFNARGQRKKASFATEKGASGGRLRDVPEIFIEIFSVLMLIFLRAARMGPWPG
jgi:hypothetical protein